MPPLTSGRVPPSDRRAGTGHPTDHEVHSVRGYVQDQLALDIGGEIEARDWLTLPEHGLRMFTSGAVFHDEVGLGEARSRLAFYPRDVWLYLLITGWWRVPSALSICRTSGVRW